VTWSFGTAVFPLLNFSKLPLWQQVQFIFLSTLHIGRIRFAGAPDQLPMFRLCRQGECLSGNGQNSVRSKRAYSCPFILFLIHVRRIPVQKTEKGTAKRTFAKENHPLPAKFRTGF